MHKTHTINNIDVPSVTENFDIVNIPNLLYWYGTKGWDACQKVMKESSKYGSQVHDAIERMLDGKDLLVTGHQRKMVLEVEKWVTQTKFNVLKKEVAVINEEDMYGGTFDVIGSFGDDPRLWVGDWKTSNRTAKSYGLQLAAYAVAHNKQYGTNIDDGFCFRMDKLLKPGKRWVEITEYHNLQRDYYPIFKACRLITGFIKYGQFQILKGENQ